MAGFVQMSTDTDWAVAAPHHRASEAAAAVMSRGGNAVDGALAAAAVLTVVYPNQTSLGGDLLALVGTPDGRVHFVNASGASAAATDAAEVVRRHHGAMPVDGAETVTVPGVVSGWERLAGRWGRAGLSGWRASLRDAADLARDGVPVSAGLARDLRRERERLVRDPGMREVFTSGGEVLREDAALRQPALARTLDLIGSDGAEAFYRGDIARSLVAFLGGRGSALTAGDFADHEVASDPTHATTFAGETYVSAGANSQGIFFLSALAALELLREDGDLDPLGADAGVIAAVLAHAARDRDRFSADPRCATVPVDHLLSEAHAREVAALARAGGVPAAGRRIRPTGDTVAVVAADGEGTWVSLIQSVFHCFGAGILDPATGIVLHNRGASFSADPASPNRLEGRKRPLHTLMPVLVRRGDDLVGAHGVMGGRAQPQVHAHVTLNLARGLSPVEAVSAPRWVLGALDESGLEAPDGARAEHSVPATAVEAMTTRGVHTSPLPDASDDVGHAQVVRRVGRALVAAADPRADGAALVGPSGVTRVTG